MKIPIGLFVCLIRKRSPKSEDDGFQFPDINTSNKCDLETLAKAQAQKVTSPVPVTQPHVFAEPKPKVSDFCAKYNIFEPFSFKCRTKFGSNSICVSCLIVVNSLFSLYLNFTDFQPRAFCSVHFIHIHRRIVMRIVKNRQRYPI